MTSQGSAFGRFKRALAAGNATIAWAAAAELPHIELADALALCLLLVDVDRPRYERAIPRWHARLCLECRRLSLSEAGLALAALHALGRPGEPAAVAALTELLGDAALPRAVEAITRWAAGRE